MSTSVRSASTVPTPAKSNSTRRKSPSIALELSRATLADSGGCDAVGITNQRATTVVFDPDVVVARGSGPQLAGPAHGL